jgi:glycosyltransferase involved in cell wall biosynthesis
MNDNFYRSSGVAIAIRRISESLTNVDCFFAGCAGDNLPEDLTWMPADRYGRFDLKTSKPHRVLRAVVQFRKWFRANRIDLVNCHHRRISTILRFAGIPVVYTGQLVFPYERWFHWFHPKWMSAITPSVAKNLLDTTGQKVLTCISNPARFPSEPPAIDLARVADRAVCIARLDPVKGHTHLLSAWKILHDRGFSYHLDLIGEGHLRQQLEAQVARDGIAHLVHFCGFSGDVTIAIQGSLFAVLASEFEGQGIVTLEAASLGRPSLLTAVPGSVDLIPPQTKLPNGVPFGDAEALANALEVWFRAPEQVVKEGQVFFDFLKSTCDPTMIAQKYRDLYARIISGVA